MMMRNGGNRLYIYIYIYGQHRFMAACCFLGWCGMAAAGSLASSRGCCVDKLAFIERCLSVAHAGCFSCLSNIADVVE